MKTIELNVNNYVMVKLTDAGINELMLQHLALSETFPSMKNKFAQPPVDKDGYTKFQMHSLMNTFGHMMSAGHELPFETVMYIEDAS